MLIKKDMVLTYMYKIQQQAMDFFHEDEYSFEKFENSDSGVMIYRNK